MSRGFITVFIDEMQLGVEILLVKEIQRCLKPTVVSGLPAVARGLLNLRGQIVVVADLRAILDRENRELNRSNRCLVLKSRSELRGKGQDNQTNDDTCNDSVGLLVDRVGEVLFLEDWEISPVPANIPPCVGRYLTGVAEVDGNVLEILSVKRVLDEGLLFKKKDQLRI